MDQKKQTNDAGKDQRIVLNLNKAQADALNALFSQTMGNSTISQQGRDISKILQKRIDRTILKQAFIQRCKADGLGKPSKAQMQGFLEDVK